MRHEITAVDRGSAAHRAGILPGDVLFAHQREDIIDEIDYQALIANRQLEMELERDGKPLHLSVRKYEVEPMGLHFGESMTLSPRTCYNNALSALSPRCRRTAPDSVREGRRLAVFPDDGQFRHPDQRERSGVRADHSPPRLAAVYQRPHHRPGAALPADEQPLRREYYGAADPAEGSGHPLPLSDRGLPGAERRPKP